MTYRSNVQAMCDRLKLPNPISEDDVKINRILFYQPGSKFIMICGDEMNRAGRLFFQEKFSGPDFRVNSVDISTEFKESAALHFAELWDDAEEAGRKLICAFKGARYLNLRWKYWPHSF